VSDALRSALHELYDGELRDLLQTYRSLFFNAEGGHRAFYMAVAAHLYFETLRRRRVWTSLVVDMLDDGNVGEIVTDLEATIEEARRQLRDGDG